MKFSERRVKLVKGRQRDIILRSSERFGSIKELSKELKIPYSTLKGYALEVNFLPEKLFRKFMFLSGVKEGVLKITYLDSNWGSKLGGISGMKAIEKKYPEKISQWRLGGLRKAIKMGRHYGYLNQKKIKIPMLNERLAEFIGVYLGDGTLSKYRIGISGDYRVDLPYFNYLSGLIEDLFDIRPVIRKDTRNNTVNLIIHSKNVCLFMHKNIGFKYGNKISNRITIPKAILKDKKLTISCFRGLIDTDGSVSRGGRKGSQFCIQFTSHNKRLLKQVDKIGRDLGIFTFGGNTGTGTNKWDNIVKYFNDVGSSNLRHIVRFYEKFYSNNVIYQRDVVQHYGKSFYKDLKLPFKLEVP